MIRSLIQSEKHAGHIGGAEDEGPNDSFTSSDETDSKKVSIFTRRKYNLEEGKSKEALSHQEPERVKRRPKRKSRKTRRRYVPKSNFAELANHVVGIIPGSSLKTLNEDRGSNFSLSIRSNSSRLKRYSNAERISNMSELSPTKVLAEEAIDIKFMNEEFKNTDEVADPSSNRNSVPELSTHPSDRQEFGAARKPFFDEFFIIGVEKESLDGVVKGGAFVQPETLWSYPGVLKEHCERRKSVKDFCFPNGIRARELDFKKHTEQINKVLYAEDKGRENCFAFTMNANSMEQREWDYEEEYYVCLCI